MKRPSGGVRLTTSAIAASVEVKLPSVDAARGLVRSTKAALPGRASMFWTEGSHLHGLFAVEHDSDPAAVVEFAGSVAGEVDGAIVLEAFVYRVS